MYIHITCLAYAITGGTYAGYFLMDLYQIADERRFSESVDRIVGTEESTVATTNSAAVGATYTATVLWLVGTLSVLV